MSAVSTHDICEACGLFKVLSVFRLQKMRDDAFIILFNGLQHAAQLDVASKLCHVLPKDLLMQPLPDHDGLSLLK